jgi:hypothetical protein
VSKYTEKICSKSDKDDRSVITTECVTVLIAVLHCTSECESYVTTDGQSASLSWNKAPIRGLRPDIY